MITFACLSCGKTMRVAEHLTGKRAKCPQCSQLTLIPEPAAASSSTGEASLGQATLPPETPIGGNDAATHSLPLKDPQEGNGSENATLPPCPFASEVPTLAFTPATHPEAAFSPGGLNVSIPGYEILQVLGRGGMGVIYKARQLQPRRLVALKMILSGEHASEEQLARFHSEAEAVARLQHPNIVQIHEVREHAGQPFLTLEYVEGGSLAQFLKTNQFQPVQAAELIQQLARGVQYAHQRGIVHRDLKPANILLRNEERGTRNEEQKKQFSIQHSAFSIPKIADFGLAKQLEGMTSFASAGHKTQTGTILGTPNYMAPEQAQGKSDRIGPAVDIYALGAILYELLTQTPPFQGDSAIDVLMKVANEEPKPPRQLCPKIPRDLETICLKCLRKDPGQRYSSAKDLAEDLRCFLEGKPIKARRQSFLERVGLFLKRRKELIYLLAGATVALILARLFIVPLFMPEPNGKEYAQNPPPDETKLNKGNDPNPPNNSSTIEKLKRAAAITESQNNLKQMAIGMHSMHEVYKGFPPPANYDKFTAKPLLSWRVHLLPFIEQDVLYKKFRLNEPWDSPHNIQLLKEMPKIYQVNWGDQPPQGHTNYQVFTGPQTMFELQRQFPGDPFGFKGLNIGNIPDGTSNTLLIAEGGNAVPWTKPEDLIYHPTSPVPKIGGPFKDFANVAFADGAVHSVMTSASEKTLRALITRNGSELISENDWKADQNFIKNNVGAMKVQESPEVSDTSEPPKEGKMTPVTYEQVQGKVLLNDVPLSGGSLTFIVATRGQKTPTHSYTATIQPDGSYILPKILTDRYLVVIEAKPGNPPIPVRYTTRESTPLIFTVEAGSKNVFDLMLKSR